MGLFFYDAIDYTFFIFIAAGFHQKVSRKLLLRVPVNASNLKYPSEISDSKRDVQDHNVSSESDDNSLAVPGMILLCVGFLCPCFRPRKRDTGDHNVISSQLNPGELIKRICCVSYIYLLTFGGGGSGFVCCLYVDHDTSCVASFSTMY